MTKIVFDEYFLNSRCMFLVMLGIHPWYLLRIYAEHMNSYHYNCHFGQHPPTSSKPPPVSLALNGCPLSMCNVIFLTNQQCKSKYKLSRVCFISDIPCLRVAPSWSQRCHPQTRGVKILSSIFKYTLDEVSIPWHRPLLAVMIDDRTCVNASICSGFTTGSRGPHQGVDTSSKAYYL